MGPINQSFNRLEEYIDKEAYKGYDPYDTLLSWIPFQWFGKWGPVLAIQIQKRNPVNIRTLLGIKKGINPKAIGLLLQTYSRLFKQTQEEKFKLKADYFFKWLKENYSHGYSGKCWGYNFPWASKLKYMNAYVPSAVVTGFVCKGLWEYFTIDNDPEAAQTILSASAFILKDLPQYEDPSGISYSYTPLQPDICYNASLLGAEVLSMACKLDNSENLRESCTRAIDFVIHRQKASGLWNYSQEIDSERERVQIDFHQGYILESIYEIKTRLSLNRSQWENALIKGLKYYRGEQFYPEGRSLWRIPREYPVEIHNQSQGIITFCKLREYNREYLSFAGKIAEWTVQHMQSDRGFFYYQKHRLYMNKISYMRWNQAWMLLALSHLIGKK